MEYMIYGIITYVMKQCRLQVINWVVTKFSTRTKSFAGVKCKLIQPIFFKRLFDFLALQKDLHTYYFSISTFKNSKNALFFSAKRFGLFYGRSKHFVYSKEKALKYLKKVRWIISCTIFDYSNVWTIIIKDGISLY